MLNETEADVTYYYYVDYEQVDQLEGDYGRFHAQWRRENPTTVSASDGVNDQGRRLNTTGRDNYIVLEATGRGHYVGCNLNIDVFERQPNDWYGEGDDMIFVDGEPWPPRLHGTGTEDYFGTAFCPTQEYCAPYHGLTVYSGTPEWPWGGKNSMYRFHVEDPIRFEREIRVTIETGHDNELAVDYSSTAYWYQMGSADSLPPLPPVAERIPRDDSPELAHR